MTAQLTQETLFDPYTIDAHVTPQRQLKELGKVHVHSSNYNLIDNVLPNFQFRQCSLKLSKIVNVSPNDEKYPFIK
jgi:hypothetical protein